MTDDSQMETETKMETATNSKVTEDDSKMVSEDDKEDTLSDASSTFSDSITTDGWEDRLAKAGSLKDKGNGQFKQQKFKF